MEKLVYLILSRDKDNFNILYADQCEKTDDPAFFTKNSQFKCWLEKSGSENFLYLAILPLFDSEISERYKVLNKIISRYHPPCSMESSSDSSNSNEKSDPPQNKETCPCCGSEMKLEKVLDNVNVIKCVQCGISTTRLK